MENKRYFDNAATTRISDEALREYGKVSLEAFGNPSANHREGAKAKALLESLRERFASNLKVPSGSIFFTSGATESIAIVMGSLLWAKAPGEVVISEIEHEAVRSWEGILKEKGWTVKHLKAKGGFVSKEDLSNAISVRTRLVAVMAVNNVTGAIEDIKGLVEVVRAKEREYGRKIFFFSDSVQALGKVDLPLRHWDVDGASFSAHKISGPRGIGALYLKSGEINALSRAGGQERGVRGGTENTPAIAAFVKAFESCPESNDDIEGIYQPVRKLLEENGIKALSPGSHRSPFILSITTPLPSEVLTRMLMDDGYCVSSGSACSNNAKGKGEGIIRAMGYSENDAKGAIRISFFHGSDKDEALNLANLIIRHVGEFKR